MELLKEHGHDVMTYRLVKDEPAQITEQIGASVGDDAVQAIIINGGTGISRRDSTFEAVDAMLEKRLDGFGEVFRYLTYQEIGSPAILTRATAGIVKGTVLFSTPAQEFRPSRHGEAHPARTGTPCARTHEIAVKQFFSRQYKSLDQSAART